MVFGFGEKKEEKEPKYVNSPLNNPMLNYKIYVMEPLEAVAVCLAFFVAGGTTGLVFFMGLFKVDGYATMATRISDTFFFVAVGMVALKVFVPVYRKSRFDKRAETLSKQFRDFLDALTTSFSTGSNVANAFSDALEDLGRQYDDGDSIVTEVREIVAGQKQGVPLDIMLQSFAARSGDEDIQSFADVFETCYHRGGSMLSIIQQTRDVIVDKAEIEDEIRTKLASNELQHNVMSVMPIAVMLILRVTNPSFSEAFASPVGVLTNAVAITVFCGAYLYGKNVIDIEV